MKRPTRVLCQGAGRFSVLCPFSPELELQAITASCINTRSGDYTLTIGRRKGRYGSHRGPSNREDVRCSLGPVPASPACTLGAVRLRVGTACDIIKERLDRYFAVAASQRERLARSRPMG